VKRNYFVTGTDTGVGKTLVAAALLHALAREGLSSVGMKPVAAGTTEGDSGASNDDVEQLCRASTVKAPLSLVCPFLLRAAVAPHIAANEEGAVIDLAIIMQAYHALCGMTDAVVVEGVGGFCVPLTDAHDTAHLAVALGLPVILVVGMRLGCLNHALLTQEAILTRGLKLAGWVANHIDPQMLRSRENVQALEQRIAAPLWADIPYGTLDGRGVEFPGLLRC
jgi:dethiobiotin synthetase